MAALCCQVMRSAAGAFTVATILLLVYAALKFSFEELKVACSCNPCGESLLQL